MTTNRLALLKRLHKIADTMKHDPEMPHVAADNALLEYISDREIEDAYRAIERWYA